MSIEETNALIIRKTLAGPKRFRPLSREELENKIIELEKKAAKKHAGGGSTHIVHDSSVMDGADAKSEVHPSTAQSKHSATRGGGSGAVEGKFSEGMSFMGAGVGTTTMNTTLGDTTRSNLGGGINSAEDINKLVSLVEEIDELKRTLAARDSVIDLQKEEIVRLRSRNAQLIAAEEDLEFHERRYKDLQAENQQLVETLEDNTRKLAEALEVSMKLKEDLLVEKESTHSEGVTLQKECERLLKQNSALLQSINSLEIEIEQSSRDVTGHMMRNETTSAGLRGKDEELRSLQDKLAKAEERQRASEACCAALEEVATQLPALKDQLREKNIAMKEMRRNLEERERSRLNKLQMQARQQQEQLGAAGSSADAKPITAGAVDDTKHADSPLPRRRTDEADSK